MYLRVFFSKRRIKNTDNKNNINGILLPLNVIAVKYIKKSIDNIKLKKVFFSLKKGNRNIPNIENLNKYPPAINSSPKGPESFDGWSGLRPKISWEKAN